MSTRTYSIRRGKTVAALQRGSSQDITRCILTSFWSLAAGALGNVGVVPVRGGMGTRDVGLVYNKALLYMYVR